MCILVGRWAYGNWSRYIKYLKQYPLGFPGFPDYRVNTSVGYLIEHSANLTSLSREGRGAYSGLIL